MGAIHPGDPGGADTSILARPNRLTLLEVPRWRSGSHARAWPPVLDGPSDRCAAVAGCPLLSYLPPSRADPRLRGPCSMAGIASRSCSDASVGAGIVPTATVTPHGPGRVVSRKPIPSLLSSRSCGDYSAV